MTQRRFHIGDILSITTGRLVSPRKIEGVYDILNFMTGESLFTHQLGRACKVAAPALATQLPQLSGINLDDVTAENWVTRLDAIVAEFGETHPVSPLPAGLYSPIDPIKELVDILTTASEAP